MSEWKPHVTVAAIIEQQGKYLMVEEHADGRVVFNQPAGHLEDGESLLEGVIRETLEETGRHFTPESLVGVYSWTNADSGITYLRFAFCGSCSAAVPERPLDEGIIATHWMSREELQQQSDRVRSPLVLRGIDDYQSGRRCPLQFLHELLGEVHGE